MRKLLINLFLLCTGKDGNVMGTGNYEPGDSRGRKENV